MRFNCRMRLLALLLFFGVAVGHAFAQSTPPVDRNVVLKVALAKDQREFRIGETIPLQLSFSSSVKKQYQVNAAQSDRSGRMTLEQFSISPAEGAVDPSPNLGSLGGITYYTFLTAEPWTIKLNLNEWVRFTQPGEYRLIVSSTRVAIRDPSNPVGTSDVTARSNEITLKIVKADPAWQKRVLNEAVAKLDAPLPREANGTDQNEIRKQAFEALRFLATADATRELVKRMRGEGSGSFDYVCMIGVTSSPERSVARAALQEALADPDRAIDGTFLYALTTINSDNNGGNTNWRETNQRVLEQLLAALPAKRGKALSVSLTTAVNEAWNGTALPQQTTDKLTAQLMSVFENLSLEQQNFLLNYRWEKIKSPAVLPLLKRYVQAYRDFPELRSDPNYELQQVSSGALRRWYELDPTGARSTIIAEISRPRPRFNARVLGMLPDKTLPELDFVLAENFRAHQDSNLASLIARYATDAILPQVVEKFEPQIGKLSCDVQDPLVAYVLRVSPATAASLIEKVLATRGKEFSGCNRDLFGTVPQLHYDPILENFAVESLNDPDPELAQAAARMLGEFGSPAAEGALRKRYTSWCEQWAGREAQLDKVFADGFNADNDQLNLGLILTQALAGSHAWLLDKAELQGLAEQTKVRRVRQQLESYLKLWEDEPIPIYVELPGNRLYARVAQYQCVSLDELKEKIAQFPAGTKFALAIVPSESAASDTAAELRQFLISHGMSVTVR